MKKNYENYEVEDFVMDIFFNHWIVDQDPAAITFWEKWLHEHPEKQSEVNQARALLLSMPFLGYMPQADRQDIVWKKIQAINRSSDSSIYISRHKSLSTSWWMKVAASVLLLVCAIVLLKNWQNDVLTYATNYGEIKTVLLPDSSRVTLNGNSRLSYAEKWEENEGREVWLEGEAYFEVQKLNATADSSSFAEKLSENKGSKFVVHAGKALDVEVLGTKFNVNQNGENVSVALHEGKIQLSIKEENQLEQVMMRPGELVEYSLAGQNYEKKVVNTDEYISWRSQILKFKEITLAEVADRLERQYGYEIIFEDEEIKKNRFTGNIPADQIELLFLMIERSFDLNVDTTANTISISHK